jgi:uncharacterized protein YllA (UPF0747 family)
VSALETQALKKLSALEKKMLRAEKRKFEETRQHLDYIKSELFPADSLQERHQNIALFYAAYSPALISMLYAHSDALAQQFTVLTLKSGSV